MTKLTTREAPRMTGLPKYQPDERTPGWSGYGGLPLLLEGVPNAARAVDSWTPEHLIERCGDEQVTAFVTDESLQGTVLQQINRSVTTSFAEIIRHIYGIDRHDQAQAYYLRVEPGTPVWEKLSTDFEMPAIGLRFNPQWSGIWLGQAGNATPFHNDQWHGLLFQVSGHKRYTMVHPFDGVRLERNWRPAAKYDIARADVLPEDAPELAGLEQCYQGVLSPGEVLYVPPFWLHQVVTLDDGNISMPTRFDTTQSPDLPLFQFSQGSCLRHLTNQPVHDLDTVVAFLRTNRANFADYEREFVRALIETRELPITPDELLRAVAG